MSKKWWLCALILVVAFISVVALTKITFSQEAPGPPEPPQQPKEQIVPVEKYLPQKSLLFITVRRASLLGEYWRSGFLYKMSQEPEIQKAFGDVKKAIESGYAEAEMKFKGVTGATFAEFFSVFQGEVAFSIVNLDTKARNPAEAIDFVFTVDAGDKKDLLIKIIEKTQETIMAMTGGQEEGPASTCYQYKGLTIYSFGTKGGAVNATFLGSRYFLTINKSTLEGIVDRYYSAEVKDSLDTNPVFKKVREKCCTGNEVLFVFADTHGLLDVFKNIFPPALNESFSTLDFQSLQAVGYASCLEKSGITRDISYAYTAGKREGFLAALTPASPVDATIYFPQDSAILFATGNLNMGAWWSNAIKSAEMFSDSQGEGSKKPLEELKSFEEKLGFSIEKDLLPSIGEHFSYYVGLPEGGGAFPEAAVLLEVKDKEKLTKCVELLLAKLGEKVRKTEFEGNTLYYVVLSDLIKSAKKRETPIPYLPALIITDKHLVVGTMPQTVKRIVEGLAQPASPTGSLKDALASLPKGASSFSYIDLAKAGGYLYNTLTLFLRDLPEGAPKIDFGALPESKTITKHLGTISGYEVADKEGIRNEITSSCGPFIIPLCFASITAAVAIPNLLESRKSASQTAAAGMLRVIATTVETFRVKYGDYPASEISPRDTEGDARLLFEAQDDCPGLEGVQDCPTINPDLAKAYTFTYTRISAEKWTCTADTNRKDSHDFFIDQSGVLRAAPSTGDGCQANENSNPSGGLEPIPVPEPIPVIPGDR